MRASQLESPSGNVFVESEPMHDLYAQGYALGGDTEGEIESVASYQDSALILITSSATSQARRAS